MDTLDILDLYLKLLYEGRHFLFVVIYHTTTTVSIHWIHISCIYLQIFNIILHSYIVGGTVYANQSHYKHIFSRGRKHQKTHNKITRNPSLINWWAMTSQFLFRGWRRKINGRRTALRGVSLHLTLTTFSPIPVPHSRKTQSGENIFPDPDPVILTGNPIPGLHSK